MTLFACDTLVCNTSIGSARICRDIEKCLFLSIDIWPTDCDSCKIIGVGGTHCPENVLEDQPEHYNMVDNGIKFGDAIQLDDGGLYSGQWRQGKRHGNGTMKFSPEDEEGRNTYEGEWKDDLMEGEGKTLYKEKNK